MQIHQQALTLQERKRGVHLITAEIIRAVPGIRQINAGLCQVFIQHTSASLTINENADPVLIPIVNGQLALGIWQGIYLCEHRNYGGSRELIVTCWGE